MFTEVVNIVLAILFFFFFGQFLCANIITVSSTWFSPLYFSVFIQARLMQFCPDVCTFLCINVIREKAAIKAYCLPGESKSHRVTVSPTKLGYSLGCRGCSSYQQILLKQVKATSKSFGKCHWKVLYVSVCFLQKAG